MPSRSSRSSRSSSSRASSTHSRASLARTAASGSNEEEDELTQLATPRTRNSNRRSPQQPRSSASLHDLELQAVQSSTASLPAGLTRQAETLNESHHSATSAYSEYSEYEEDEFDPQWHARQNRQAALAMLNRSGGQASTAAPTHTAETRSIVSDLESLLTGSSTTTKEEANLFARRRDLREEVDQTVNLMNVDASTYDDPREYGGRRPRRGRRGPESAGFLERAQHSLVDVFLDSSDQASFRRTLSRTNNNNGSLRRQPTPTAGTHQRRLFYGHTTNTTTPIREGQRPGCCSLENCCKLLIVLFVLFFVLIVAFPEGTWWIQKQLGLLNDDGTVHLPQVDNFTVPSLPELPIIGSENDNTPKKEEEPSRLDALHKMILAHGLTSQQDLVNEETPQYQASFWMAHEDPAQLTLLRNQPAMVEPHKILNRYALVTFYIAMNGPRQDDSTGKFLWNETHWHANDEWMSAHHICDWYGVECEGQNHIERLNLTRNSLKGSIPSELTYLTNLISVDWSQNQLSGILPEFVGNKWLNLEYLFLTKNEHMKGTLPASLGNLTHLQELQLAHTNLHGSIPSQINQLTQLRVLRIDHNRLSGSIPPLGELAPSLEYLDFYDNQLTGFMPSSLFQLTNLVLLKLDHNHLTGTIAPELEAFHKLEGFTIGNNQINGSLPDIWDKMPRLAELEVDKNHIGGTIPSSIGVLTDLEFLTLQDNPLTGTIPTELGNLESLDVLQVYHTELVGTMPESICSLKVRRGIDLIVFGDCQDGRFQCQCCDRCYP